MVMGPLDGRRIIPRLYVRSPEKQVSWNMARIQRCMAKTY
jgi:hypothetical protein